MDRHRIILSSSRGDQLWASASRIALGIAKSAHLATDVVFQDAIKCVAARVPEDHARRILLDMPEVKTGSEVTVIEVVHACSPEWKPRARGMHRKKGPRPSPAGPFW